MTTIFKKNEIMRSLPTVIYCGSFLRWFGADFLFFCLTLNCQLFVSILSCFNFRHWTSFLLHYIYITFRCSSYQRSDASPLLYFWLLHRYSITDFVYHLLQ
ncbi:hypothetical protein AQUCO_00200732v1 [Aquilegia coerulea]|uniref:Uncharacterized protein n=1 Tax=Aquilegia coerulea TaxID=218851 RepID=A0A2G5F4N5_AQUCA|nr:hypothetical protein AQUCO_00200732v1 [Aquilegia coerulea]